jgi:hypothetical protein
MGDSLGLDIRDPSVEFGNIAIVANVGYRRKFVATSFRQRVVRNDHPLEKFLVARFPKKFVREAGRRRLKALRDLSEELR